MRKRSMGAIVNATVAKCEGREKAPTAPEDIPRLFPRRALSRGTCKSFRRHGTRVWCMRRKRKLQAVVCLPERTRVAR